MFTRSSTNLSRFRDLMKPKQTGAKNHQSPKGNRSRQPKPLPEQSERCGNKGGSQPSQKQVTAEAGPEAARQEVSDGQISFSV